MPRHRATPGPTSNTRTGGRKGTMPEPPADLPKQQDPQPTDEAQPAETKEDNANGKRPAEGEALGGTTVGLKRQKMASGRHGLVVGPRIPYEYFITKVKRRAFCGVLLFKLGGMFK